MAEIGVLELQIRDNAKDAGTGLKSLADALYKVKAQTENKIGLSKVGTELNALAKQINGTQSNTPTIIKNITSLMNSLTGFSKIKSLHIDTKSIDSLKNAVSGFNIGNAGSQMRSLQQAISGNWDTNGFAQAAGTIVSAGNIFDSNGTASKLSTVTSALTKFTKAYKDLPNSTKKMENVLGNFAVTDYKSEYEAAAERAREAFERSGRHGIAFDPQQFGGKGSGRRKSVLKAEQMQMDLDQIGTSVTEKYSDVETTIESTTRGIEDLNIRLHETKDTITSIVETVSAMQSSSLSIIPYSGGGGTYDQMFQHRAVAQENMLSTYVDYSKQFAPNWKEADTNINAADAAVQNLRDHMGDMNSYLENSTTYADRLAQSLGNMGHGGSIILYDENYYNRMMDKAREYWEYNKNTAEDAMLSTRRSSEEFWKPDFTMEGGRQDWSFLKEGAIEAEGSVSEQTVFSSIEEMAEALNMTVDEVKQKLQDTYNMVYSSGPSVTVFSSAEEAAKSLGKTVEEVLQEAQETYNKAYGINNSGSVADSTPVIDVDKFLETYSHLDYLEQKYDHLKGKLSEKLAMGDIISKDTIDKDVQTLKKLEDEIKKLKESATEPVSGGSLIDVDQFISTYSHIDYLKSKLEDLKARLAEGVQFKTMDSAEIDKAVSTIQNLEDEIKKLEDAEKNAGSATQKLANAFGLLKSGAKKLFPTLTGIVGRFASIAKYRVLRSIIKNISDGFKEGWENLKGYKEAIGDEFATAIGNANAQLLTMKNSIGAAVAPALQALLPILNSIVSAVITVINWVNQLISLLTGKSTWTKATEASADSLDNVKKSAGGASSAVKDLLADWDELNIIQSDSGGGGGGGGGKTATDYENMFEEVGTFDEKLKQFVEFVKENLDEIAVLAGAIGTAILGWKISKAFEKALPLLAKIGTGLAALGTITISLVLTDLLGKEFVATGEPGWFIADAITGAVGPFLAGELVKKIAGSAAGEVTAGFTLILEGAINIKNAVSAMEQLKEGEAWALAALGSVEAGIGAGLAAFGLDAGVAGSILAGVSTFVFTIALTAAILLDAKTQASYKQMAYDAFRQTGDGGISVEDYIAALQERFAELTKDASLVIDTSIKLEESQGKFQESIDSLKSLNAFLTSGESLTEEQAKEFKNAWSTVFDQLEKMGKLSYETIFAGLTEAIKNGTEETKKAATELKKTAVEVARITGGARAAAQEEMSQIVNEITGGNMDRVDRYFELYNIWGKEDETSTEIQKYIDMAMSQGFKFSENGNPVQEAKDMLTRIQQENVEPALELVKQQYEASVKGIEEQQKELEKGLESGYITKEQFDNATKGLDKILALFKTRFDEQTAKITAIRDDAYDKIADQLYEGYFKMTDEQGRQKYIDEVINPVLEVFEAAKKQIPDKVKNILALRESGTDNSKRVSELAELAGRQSVYQMVLDELLQSGEYTDTTSAAWRILSTEGLNMQGAAEKLSTEEQQEIVNALLPLFPEVDAGNILQLLHDQLNFDYLTMLSGIDFAGLNGRKYTKPDESEETYESSMLIEEINDFINEHNYNNPQETIAPLDMSKFNEGFENSIDVMHEWMGVKDELDNTWNIENGLGNGDKISGRTKIPGVTQASGDFAFAGAASGIQYAPYNPEGQGIQSTDISGDVQTGVENGSTQQVSLLGQLLSVMNAVAEYTRQTAAKEFSVTISPSADWGLHNQRSGEAAESVTG